MNRTTPMQRLLIAMANISVALPVPRVRKEELVLVDIPGTLTQSLPPLPRERNADLLAHLAPFAEHPKDDELLTLALNEGARQADAIADGLDRPVYRNGKFWNVGKTEVQHKKLKAKRKAERLARRKNRR